MFGNRKIKNIFLKNIKWYYLIWFAFAGYFLGLFLGNFIRSVS
jgi:hypothetical protein